MASFPRIKLLPARGLLLIILAYFLALTADGLNAYFTLDDGRNLHTMHGFFEKPFRRAVTDAVVPFTGAYRPVGGLFYRSIFAMAGFHPFPLRLACLLLMLANLLLTYALVKRLASVEIALLATLIFSYHPGLIDLYYSTGTVYDILCYFFYASSLLYYVKSRQEGRSLGWRRTALLLALYSCALNSKEMAVTLPLSLAAFELVYHPPKAWRFSEARGFLATSAFTIASLAPKLLTRNPLSIDARYHPRFSPGALSEAISRYQDILFYQDHFFNAGKLFVLWALMGLLAHLLRSRPLKFSLAFSIFSMLPACVIDIPRNGFVLYLPMLGWAIFVASLISSLRSRLVPDPRPWLFVLTGIALLMAHLPARARLVALIHQAHENARRIPQQIQQLHPTLKRGAHILFLDDPLPAEDWSLVFFLRLNYQDPGIWVDRVKQLRRPVTEDELTLYNYAFTYENGKLKSASAGFLPGAPAPPGRPIAVTFLPDRIRPGESYVVIVKDYPEQTLDVAFTMAVDNAAYSDVLRKWCILDESGRATLATPSEHPRGAVRVRKIRTQRGPWLPAEGRIEVL